MTAPYVLETDGGARGNPGPAGAAFVLRDPHGSVAARGGRFLGEATNNVAEYEALVWGLQVAHDRGVTSILVRCDSELVVRQIRGEYRVKHVNMRPLHASARRLLESFDTWAIEHVRREHNADADALVNAAIDARGTVGDVDLDVGPACDTLF